ncbi:MAG: thioredoxin family protein, partial [Anaerolineae bacterium]
ESILGEAGLKSKGTVKAETWRPWLAILVLIAVVAVGGLKVLRDRSATRIASAASTNAATSEDGMPADPAGQLLWVEANRHPAMVIYRSTTCIPCVAMGKLIEQVRADYEPEVAFVTVLTDASANILLVRQAGIQAIPTSFFLGRDGQPIKVLGAMDESTLRDRLQALKMGNRQWMWTSRSSRTRLCWPLCSPFWRGWSPASGPATPP